jgi:hypothetical protein
MRLCKSGGQWASHLQSQKGFVNLQRVLARKRATLCCSVTSGQTFVDEGKMLECCSLTGKYEALICHQCRFMCIQF